MSAAGRAPFTVGAAAIFGALAAILVISAVATPATARNAPGSFADQAERLTPAVVNISSSQRVSSGAMSGELQSLQRKFGRPAVSLGSGFIIDAAGIVVTNNHVIDGADDITVTLHDGREFAATLRGRDKETDLAVLQLDGGKTKFPYVRFGTDEHARVGDWVIAIGNPFGLGGSVTVGIISARNRDIQSGLYDDFIQTDAAINRGNSGGPLFDLEGNVIGVNTAIYSQTGGSVGVGFAIPADLAENIVDQIISHGEARRGWLGVNIDDLSADRAKALGLSAPSGALVTVVRSNSPASEAGILADDVILKFNRKTITSVRDLTRAVADTPIGSRVPVEVLREGRRLTFNVTVDERSVRMLASMPAAPLPETAARAAGLTLQEPTEEVKRAFNLPPSVQGVVVTEVDPESPAAIVLRPGDIILEIGWERVTRPEAAVALLDKLSNLNRGPAQIYVQRGDLLFYESLRP
ncbi:MAG: Do family serine endopeptidase [Pseudomonadota bacterium]